MLGQKLHLLESRNKTWYYRGNPKAMQGINLGENKSKLFGGHRNGFPKTYNREDIRTCFGIEFLAHASKNAGTGPS